MRGLVHVRRLKERNWQLISIIPLQNKTTASQNNIRILEQFGQYKDFGAG